jgi:hypothetical protein
MTPLPIPTIRYWLEFNYRMYSNYHLCQKLGIGERQLKLWFKNLNITKRMSRQVLTPEQEKLIKDNYLRMTHQQIADMIGGEINVGHVQRYCFNNNLKKIGKGRQLRNI